MSHLVVGIDNQHKIAHTTSTINKNTRRCFTALKQKKRKVNKKRNLRRKRRRYRNKLKREKETIEDKKEKGKKEGKNVLFDLASFENSSFELDSFMDEDCNLSPTKPTNPATKTSLCYDV